MVDFEAKDKAARILGKQLLALEDLVRETRDTGNTILGFDQLGRWKNLTVELLAETMGESEAAALRDKKLAAFFAGQPLRNFLAETELYEVFLVSLNRALQEPSEQTCVLEMATDLFISYSGKDRDFVEKLATDLVFHGIKVWWDKWIMKGRGLTS